MQLFDLKNDPAERTNLAKENPEKVEELLKVIEEEVRRGRCTPGEDLPNDREVKFLPEEPSK